DDRTVPRFAFGFGRGPVGDRPGALEAPIEARSPDLGLETPASRATLVLPGSPQRIDAPIGIGLDQDVEVAHGAQATSDPAELARRSLAGWSGSDVGVYVEGGPEPAGRRPHVVNRVGVRIAEQRSALPPDPVGEIPQGVRRC